MSWGYLLDTNHVGHAVTPGSVVRQRIEDVLLDGENESEGVHGAT